MAVTASSDTDDAVAPALKFLGERTPESWVEEAVTRIPELLLDHANCELKAASTALAIIYRYTERSALANRMSRLAREELRHFEQVRDIMRGMEIPFIHLAAGRYAGELRGTARHGEPHRLLDLLLVGAFIEARSCERFATVAPRLPKSLGDFYRGLLAAEARHFEHYLAMARSECDASDAEISKRIADLRDFESALITGPDAEFRFHSGVPHRN